jgi:hypothetical protein
MSAIKKTLGAFHKQAIDLVTAPASTATINLAADLKSIHELISNGRGLLMCLLLLVRQLRLDLIGDERRLTCRFRHPLSCNGLRKAKCPNRLASTV